MAYEPKPNSGTLWPNDRKNSQNHPDVRGDLFLDRELLRTLATKNKDQLIKVSVAGWNKVIAGKDCITLSASEPYDKPPQSQYRPQPPKPAAKPQPERADYDDSDIPF